MTAPTAASRVPGDIVSEYLWLVIPFGVLQLTSWVIGLLEVFRAVGPVAYAAMDAMYPLDISFCQMMFWGTLHHGPISDGRLAVLCRVAFVIEAICFMVSCLTVFRPISVEDGLAALNATATATEAPPSLSLYMGYFKAAFWFLTFGPFAAWVGTTALQIGRRRLLDNKPHASLPPFSTSFLRGYVGILVAQLLLMTWSIVRTVSIVTTEDLVFTIKLNYAIRGVSMSLAQLFGWKAVIFDASGVSMQSFRQGKGTKLQMAAIGCIVLYLLIVWVDLLLFAFATSSADPILYFHNVLEIGLENLPMMGVWLCAAVNFGLSWHHLHPMRSVDDTESMMKRTKEQKGATGSTAKVTPLDPMGA